MNKDLQDHVWSVLPKEFKEEVKEEYFACKHCSAEASAMELEIIFGIHNLTSDAEGEEMLCSEDYEPNPAEPRFKVGDKVRIISVHGRPTPYKGAVEVIAHINDGDKEQMYYLENTFACAYGFSESDLEPYTEPADLDKESSTCTNDCPSQCPSQNFDNIVNRGFRDHNRLHIAAMAMHGILANSHQEMVDMKIDKVAELAIEAADALIAECEKTDKNNKI